MPRRAGTIRLVPVLDVYAAVLSGEDGGPFREPRWDAFYRGRVVAAGLPAPIDAHPWLVRAADLRPGPGLARLVRDAVGGDALDEIPELPGGYTLDDGDRCLALPGCCAGLGTLDDWAAAIRHAGTDRAMLWTGHPWLSVSADEDLLTLSGPAEDDTGPEFVSVTRQALLAAVGAAGATRARFAEHLRTVCAELAGPDAAAEVAARLIGAQ